MRYLTIHCAATTASMDIGVDEIRQWHLARGWRDVGYHYVIRRDGTLERGRPESQTGAHVGGYNTGNIGVCMAGGVKDDGVTPEDNFTAAQWSALDALLTELHERYPKALIMGHNGFPGHESRGCPCFDWRTYRDGLHDMWADTPEEWHGHWIEEVDAQLA
ncbi:N-acetylmuramoyl-L-alanine amidase [Vreelandella profundi]|uniref:N-acetylmuramoyl-L-alanine amidase n=1 Tax=Vreelandella profundi TaxID=2852117 RepID=UPI001EFFC924|nr:N-acetylmuramoyl-L-alanine amidase [Halomonas profundi]